LAQAVIAQMLFEGPLEDWWQHRQGLVKRHDCWHTGPHAVCNVDLEAARTLFPPTGIVSDSLAASATWRPARATLSKAVLVNACGIYGGDDGPSGLWHYLARERAADWSFLLLDTGHRLDVARAVVHDALSWLLDAHPEMAGHIILTAFSMGSAVMADMMVEFADAVCGIIIVAGQSAGTEGLANIGPRPVLIIQGECDPMVSPACALNLSRNCRAAGARVQLNLVPQSSCAAASGIERMKLHHLRDERWEVHRVVAAWLDTACSLGTRAASPASGQQQSPPPPLVAGPLAMHSSPADDVALLLERAAAAVDDVALAVTAEERALAESAGR